MTISNDQRLADVHAEAQKAFNAAQSAQRNERQQCLEDRRFYSIAGAQWEGALQQQFENKPMFEVNKVHLAVIRIINEYRNNRIDVTFSAKDGGDDDLTDVCAALYRADEQNSQAEEAYDNGFEEAVGGGFGAWRLRADYEDDEDDDNDQQRVFIEPIFDADSCVFFDANAKRQDKSDAKRCWVLTGLSTEEYEEEYGEFNLSSFPKGIKNSEFDWASPDVVYIAEYYVVEKTKDVIHTYKQLAGQIQKYTDSDFENDPDLEENLKATGWHEISQKKIKRTKIHKYIMSGNKVLEDCGYIAGRYIPIVPVYGKRWYIDGVERCMGHVRLSKDAQRLKNMMLSKVAEISALSSVEKPILTPEQVNGHMTMWAEDNIKNYPYLLLNPLKDAMGNITAMGPTAYTKAPDIPAATAALLSITEQDIQDLLGNQQAGEQMQSNISGKVVELIQNRLDMQAFIYMSNMAKAVKRSGEIWLSMARDLYVEDGRKMKGIDGHGEVTQIELMKPTIDKNGAETNENDLSKASFDLVVGIGPSSESKRQAIVRSLISLMQIIQDPETIQVLGAMVIMNMDGEGLSDARSYYRKKLLQLGVIEPTDEEAQEMAQQAANQPPDPNAELADAMAQQAKADAVKKNAQVLDVIAGVELKKSQTAQTLSQIDDSKLDQILRIVEQLGQPSTGGEIPQAQLQTDGASAQPPVMSENLGSQQ